MLSRIAATLAMIFIICGHAVADDPAASRTVFVMNDPVGDDRGRGDVSYPSHETFHPYRLLLDLTRFEVRVSDDRIAFRLTMGQIADPFQSPEGFFHPRIDIFVQTEEEGGLARPLREGSGVTFHDPWHRWVRVAPFGGSAIYSWTDPPDADGDRDGISVTTDSDVIVVDVPRSAFPEPNGSWRYYVLIGSFDALGPDGYRALSSGDSEWLLGGDPNMPRVVDILAPPWGPRRQELQLAPSTATVFPVGGFDPFRWPLSRYVIGLAFGLISAAFIGSMLPRLARGT